MKCHGAVLLDAGTRWEVREIDLGPPRAGEVLVQMAVAGICHSDDHYATGDGVAGQRLTAIMTANGIPLPDLYPSWADTRVPVLSLRSGQACGRCNPAIAWRRRSSRPVDPAGGARRGRVISAISGQAPYRRK